MLARLHSSLFTPAISDILLIYPTREMDSSNLPPSATASLAASTSRGRLSRREQDSSLRQRSIREQESVLDDYDAPHEDSYSIPDEDSYHEDSYHDASDQEHIDTLLPPIITRSSLWIPDGNIVLEAEHTQFKFYRGLLARHSTFFRNLFDSMFPPGSDPHIEDDIELVEGCPVVCLADSADDVGYMLHFIVDT